MAHYLASFNDATLDENAQAARAQRLEAATGTTSALPSSLGARLYQGACAVCHEVGGLPLFGSRPSLALNSNLHSRAPDNLVQVILHGIMQPASSDLGYMPAFKDAMSDEQLAELVDYLRKQFAPDKPAVDRRQRDHRAPAGRRRHDALCLRRIKLRPRAGKRGSSALDAPERLRNRGDRLRRTARVDADEIGWPANLDAVIVEPHQPRGSTRDHVEASGKIGRPRDMADIGIEVRHPDQRRITVGRERIEHIVGRDRAGDARLPQRLDPRDAARHGVIVTAAHQMQVGRRQDRHRDAGIGEARSDGS